MQRLLMSLALVASSFLVLDASLAVTPDDLCTGDPCTISGVHDLEADPLELDFGTREVILTGTARITVTGPDPNFFFPPDVTLRMGDFTMQPGLSAPGGSPLRGRVSSTRRDRG